MIERPNSWFLGIWLVEINNLSTFGHSLKWDIKKGRGWGGVKVNKGESMTSQRLVQKPIGLGAHKTRAWILNIRNSTLHLIFRRTFLFMIIMLTWHLNGTNVKSSMTFLQRFHSKSLATSWRSHWNVKSPSSHIVGPKPMGFQAFFGSTWIHFSLVPIPPLISHGHFTPTWIVWAWQRLWKFVHWKRRGGGETPMLSL